MTALRVALGEPLPAPGHDRDHVLAAAAAGAAPGSDDPVDRATFAAAAAAHDLRQVQVAGYTRPAAARRYSLATVTGLEDGGATHVARGDFASVADLCGLDGATRKAAVKLAMRCKQAGFRPWAIATASLPEGAWSLLGVIPVRATAPGRAVDRDEFVFVKIWSFLLRFLHWSWAVLILALIVTGLEIQSMYLSAGTTWYRTGFFFGYVRLVHYVCGWLLAAALVARLADALLTRNRFEDWRSLIPFKNRKDVAGFVEELGNYAFLRNDEGKAYLSHDPLQQAAFSFAYLAMLAAALSGFSLYSLYDPRDWFFQWFNWPVRHFGANPVRLFHESTMWLLILFVPAHFYLVIRADGYAREGSLSAMLSGGRWVRRGARFEDAPDPQALDLRAKS